MSMKVLIVGSVRLPEHPNHEQAIKAKKYVKDFTPPFTSACKAIGWALAQRKHTIVSGVSSWSKLAKNGVAPGVAAGVEAIAGAGTALGDKNDHKAIFYDPPPSPPGSKASSPENRWRDVRKETEDTVELELKPHLGHERSSTNWYPNLAEVDAVVLIGGKEGTRAIGYAAHSAGKPCVAIAWLGGAAAELSGEILQDDYMGLVNPHGLKKADVAQWSDPWTAPHATQDVNEKKRIEEENNTHAAKVVDGLEKLAKAQSTRGSKRAFDVIFGAVTALLILWLTVYLEGARGAFLSTAIPFFLMLYMSALLGTGLRILTAYKENELTQITLQALLIDAVMALLVAFGLGLLYIIGGISFTGKVVVLDVSANAGTADVNFVTVALSMSLLGLAAGYLMPLKELQLRLQNLYAEAKK